MIKIFNTKISAFLIVLILWSNSIFADPPVIPEDPGVPIDNWIPVIVFVAISLAFYYKYKKQAIKN